MTYVGKRVSFGRPVADSFASPSFTYMEKPCSFDIIMSETEEAMVDLGERVWGDGTGGRSNIVIEGTHCFRIYSSKLERISRLI